MVGFAVERADNGAVDRRQDGTTETDEDFGRLATDETAQ